MPDNDDDDDDDDDDDILPTLNFFQRGTRKYFKTVSCSVYFNAVTNYEGFSVCKFPMP
jgi:hypothetical protein